MFEKVQQLLQIVFRRKSILPTLRSAEFRPVLFPVFFRRVCCAVLGISLVLSGCGPVNTSSTPFVMPTIADPAVQGLMTYFSGLLGREDLLSRHTLDDGVVALEAILVRAGWGKAINHNDYEKVIDGVQKHLDDPNAPFFEPTPSIENPYPEGTWEHETFDTRNTSTCARDFPELAKSNPELCK